MTGIQKWKEKGVISIQDILDNDRKSLTFKSFQNKFKIKCNFLSYLLNKAKSLGRRESLTADLTREMGSLFEGGPLFQSLSLRRGRFFEAERLFETGTLMRAFKVSGTELDWRLRSTLEERTLHTCKKSRSVFL